MDINDIAEDLMMIDPLYDIDDIKKLESEYKCSITFNVEKHNMLQY